MIEPLKDKLFPKTFEYKRKAPDGTRTTESAVLFGDLVEATELAVDLAQSSKTDPIWRQKAPDLYSAAWRPLDARRGTRTSRRRVDVHPGNPALGLSDRST